MKNIAVVFGAFLTLFLISCEGDPGPPGPPGFDGEQGQQGPAGPVGKVLEFEDNFTADNNYALFYEFPNSVELLESDVVLVYLSFDQIEDNTGQPVEVWRLLPQTRILDQGLLQYNYDHTFLDVNIFLEADFELTTLPAGDTDNQYFRIAILPADFAQTSKMDVSNIASVMSALGVTEKEVQKINMN